MAFTLSDEHEAIRDAVREFGENEMVPVAEEHDQEGKYPEELRKKAAEYDFVAPSICSSTAVPGWTRSPAPSLPRNSGVPTRESVRPSVVPASART